MPRNYLFILENLGRNTFKLIQVDLFGNCLSPEHSSLESAVDAQKIPPNIRLREALLQQPMSGLGRRPGGVKEHLQLRGAVGLHALTTNVPLCVPVSVPPAAPPLVGLTSAFKHEELVLNALGCLSDLAHHFPIICSLRRVVERDCFPVWLRDERGEEALGLEDGPQFGKDHLVAAGDCHGILAPVWHAA